MIQASETPMIKTEDIATRDELKELFSMDEEDDLDINIPVCAGEWIAETENTWRFWKYDTGDEE